MKRIELVELSRIVSKKALQAYNDTDPCYIFRHGDLYLANICGEHSTCKSECELSELLEAYAEEAAV